MIEISINLYRKNNSKFGDTYIKDVNLLSSKVTHLVITRPKGFQFKSGDYMFIKIPSLAKHEWHPFTISSATELKDEIWVHVRSLGTWTNGLNQYFTNMAKEESEKIRKAHELSGNSKDILNSKVSQHTSNMVIVTDYSNNEENNNKPKKEVSLISNKLNSVFIQIKLDGPYGTASGRILESEHAVLIAGGFIHYYKSFKLNLF